MLIARLTDYAVVVLAQLATGAEALQAVPALGRSTGFPEATIAKILKQLAGAGLVRARRGAEGGYTLARPANEITILDVIEACEGPMAITACADAASPCRFENDCSLRGNWAPVNARVRAALAAVSLTDLMSGKDKA